MNSAEALNLGRTETLIVDDGFSIDQGYAKGGERALLAALLFDGVQSYLGYAFAESPSKRSRYREAYLWVSSNDREYVFSFENCCEGLGISANAMRCGLTKACTLLTGKWKRGRRKF